MNKLTLEKQMSFWANERHIPLNGSIELLPLCNMNCDMCYVRLSKEEMNHIGRMRTLGEWIEISKQMQKAGVLFLLLTGGKPLLYPDFKKLFIELKKMGMILTINTNGTLIDEEWADFFSEYKPRRVNITLYGSNEDTYRHLCHYSGGFEKVINGIKKLRERGVDVKINGSLVAENIDDMEEIANIAKALEVPFHVDTYMYPATRERDKPFNLQTRLSPEDAALMYIKMLKKEKTNEDFNDIRTDILYCESNTLVGEDKPGKMKCRAGKGSFTINWQGEMRPCVMLSSPAISVFEVGFDAAWKYIVEETSKIRLSSKCNQCTLRDVCNTCAACALLETGSYAGVPEYMCRYTKEALKILKQE